MTGVINSIKPVDESSLNFALKTARKEFKHNGLPEADKAIVLVTDGWSTDTNTPYYHSNLAAREGPLHFWNRNHNFFRYRYIYRRIWASTQ